MWVSVRVCVFGNKNIYRTHWKPVDTAIFRLPDNLGCICVQCVWVGLCALFSGNFMLPFFSHQWCWLPWTLFVRTLVLRCHSRSISLTFFFLFSSLSHSFLLSFSLSLSFCRSQSFKMWNDDGYDKTSVKNHFQKTVFIIRSRHFRIYMHIIYPSNAVDENFEMFPVHIYFVLIQCSRQLMIDCMLYVCRYRRCCYCCRYSKLVCLVEEKIVLL